MNTSNEKQETKTDKPKGGPEPIAVRLMKFAQQIDVPGKNFTSSLTSERKGAGAYWEIQYWPWMRHHKITWHPPGDDVPRSVFVHEVHVASWEPVP